MEKTLHDSAEKIGRKKHIAILKQDGDWWIGWVEEVPGVNAQEKTKPELLTSLRQILSEALESIKV